MSRSSSPKEARRRCLVADPISSPPWWAAPRRLTVLDQDAQALLDQQRGIEDDQSEAQGQDVVAGADFEEFSDALLCISDVSKECASDWRACGRA